MREINLHVTDYQFEWEYTVIQSDQINAFCLPGGKICVFTGLLRIVENDDQLAAVLAHEVSHALAHHQSERIARERMVGSGILALHYDREQESEADHIGVFLMTFAGYNPRQAVVFWRKMESLHARRCTARDIVGPSERRAAIAEPRRLGSASTGGQEGGSTIAAMCYRRDRGERLSEPRT